MVSSNRDPMALVRVARRYHLDGWSQQQIADEEGISRSNVSRMLSAALEQGIVRVTVHDPSGRALELEAQLVAAFGLEQARVAVWGGPASSGEDPLERVGVLASELLLELATDGARVALSWGRALQAMVKATAPAREHRARLVQLVGGLPSVDDEISGQELVRDLVARLGATGQHYLHAPAVLTTPEARDALLTDRSVAEALADARRADVAFVGVGSPVHGSSARVLEALAEDSPERLQEFWAAHPVGDVALRYFDELGRPVLGWVDDRVVGVSLEDLLAIPTVVGVVSGQSKLQGVLGALRGHVLDVLVCDEGLARSLVDAARERHPATVAG